ncbi:MAG: hypothetical protein R3F62_05635 [Planctomycetota bacterium]
MRSWVMGALIGSCCAAAQAGEPWETRAALTEALRTVEVATHVFTESERGDPRPAVEALQDPAWPVRLLACQRLAAHKLDEDLVAALARASGPGQSGPSRDGPDYQAARDFAEAVRVGGEIPQKPSRDQVVQGLVTVILSRVLEGPDEDKRALLEAVLPYTGLVGGDTQRWVVAQFAQLLPPTPLLHDLGAKTLKEALGQRGRRVVAWYADHREQLVWDKGSKGFLIQAR